MGVWNSSRHTVQEMTPVFRARSIFTSQDFSWLQKGQVNWVSRVPVIFFFGGGFRLDFLRPITAEGIKPRFRWRRPLAQLQGSRGQAPHEAVLKAMPRPQLYALRVI